ncbi:MULTISPECIES: glycine cleavage system protein H [Carnobacterium]|uniref:Glycine cleavage system protein H n=1 Tax=Carnobacterium antarcticum TaxID=2126436 RepID=A0ABW4NP81_9LACT|nr:MULTISPECIES: glycine cleavage system protein H [unclassified Carnobacterium]ALV22786.1 Glycine cleavage system H protein [Carnobacterium sp. CP1]QQP70679.1 glycine cleavage system protein H [Carnobacterium sp. CS13]
MTAKNTMKYSENGLWILKDGSNYRIGLSEKGQDDLGEVMFVEVPSDLNEVATGDNLIGVEGAKAVTELTAPFSGKVSRFNEALADDPEKLNSPDPQDNWILDLSEVDEAAFNALSDTI